MDNENNNVTPEEPGTPDITETPETAVPEPTVDQVAPEAQYQEPQFEQPQYQQPTYEQPYQQSYQQPYQQQYQQPYGQPYQQIPVNPGKGMSIASLVLGICSIPLAFIWVGIAAAIVGIILGVIGKKKSQEVGAPTGMASAGVICSIIALALDVLIVVACSSLLCYRAANGYY